MNAHKIWTAVFMAICFLCLLTSCDTSEKSTYRIEIGDMSTNFKSNLYLQSAVNDCVEEYRDEAVSELRTEKEAKRWFDNACNDIKQKTDALDLPMLEDCWVVLELTDYTKAIRRNRLDFSEGTVLL